MDPIPLTNRLHRRRPWTWVVGIFIAILLLAFLVCELMGWPFLAKPAERWLGKTLQREVQLTAPGSTSEQFKLRLLGGIRLDLAYAELGSPTWSKAPFMLQGKNLSLVLRYRDLLAWRNQPEQVLRIHSLRADELNGHLERLADGRASWQFTEKKPEEEKQPLPAFGLLAIKTGEISYNDEPLALELNAALSLQEGEIQGDLLQVNADGKYQGQKLGVKLASTGVLPWVAEQAKPIPVALDISLGNAKLVFRGKAADALQMQALSGSFVVSGTSLGAAGKALGVTLPNTPPFRTEGSLVRDASTWRVSVSSAKIGSSNLNGDFVYTADKKGKLLTGVLKGKSLVLADLAPSLGAGATTARSADKPAGKVLPDKGFDLPSLRAMNADVRVDIDNLDLGSSVLQPLRPLRAQVAVTDGVLDIREIDARTAQGQLAGDLSLDGREDIARWNANLNWNSIQLADWVKVPRNDKQPPYISGQMSGSASLTGEGRSTADILGSLNGQVRTQVRNGTISHLVIEAAGLDAAEALGVWFTGDDELKMNCAVANLQASNGVLQPTVFVIDTTDSALWVNGKVSMKTEALDLRVVVTPKDFSPLSLRTPLLISGTMAAPDISLEKGPLAGKVAGAALLSLINPLAALIPFVDTGRSDSRQEADRDGCYNLAERAKAQKAKAK